ncbi:Hypothetical protein D9617_11g010370 [Elsinoe fawcettii]|nr:Hypothetical protein D9617_11g010370 [Elsinoe fawcettii]
MPPSPHINFCTEDELNPPPADQSPNFQSSRERFMSQPNISQPRAAKPTMSEEPLNDPNVQSPTIANGSTPEVPEQIQDGNQFQDEKEQMPMSEAGQAPSDRGRGKSGRRGRGGRGCFGRRTSRKHNAGDIQEQQLTQQSQYLPFHPPQGYTGAQQGRKVPVYNTGAMYTGANNNGGYAQPVPYIQMPPYAEGPQTVTATDNAAGGSSQPAIDPLLQVPAGPNGAHHHLDPQRPATAGPHFGHVDFNPGASSHVTHTDQKESENSVAPHPPSSTSFHPTQPHSNKDSHANNTTHLPKETTKNMPKQFEDPLAKPPPKLGKYFPGVPVAHVFAPNKPIRPVDLLHSHIEGLNHELDRIMAAIKQPSIFSDPQAMAWKEDVVNRLTTEIIPALGITTTRVANAIRDGMYANSGSIRFQTGEYPVGAYQAQQGAPMPAQSHPLGAGHFADGYADHAGNEQYASNTRAQSIDAPGVPAANNLGVQYVHDPNHQYADASGQDGRGYHPVASANDPQYGEEDDRQHAGNAPRAPTGPRADRSHLHGRTQGQPSGYDHGITQGRPTGHLLR